MRLYQLQSEKLQMIYDLSQSQSVRQFSEVKYFQNTDCSNINYCLTMQTNTDLVDKNE